jgi:hypothetical protein
LNSKVRTGKSSNLKGAINELQILLMEICVSQKNIEKITGDYTGGVGGK